MTPADRIAAINDLVDQFDQTVSEVEGNLMDRLAEAATHLLENPAYLSTVLRDWKPQWVALIQELATGLLDVADLNSTYFAALEIDPGILSSGTSDLLTAVGIGTTGLLVEGGYLGQLLNDTSIGRQVVSLLTDAKLRKLSESNLVSRMKALVKGKQTKGIAARLFDSLDTQPHVEADRYIQRAIAIRAKLTASLYLGGLIDSSRPFCVVRNGKVFLDSETELFGTSKDTYGGYADKSTGYFSGKPRSGYDPFTMCGGHSCRHHRSYISNSEALRRRDDLEEVRGVLRIKKS